MVNSSLSIMSFIDNKDSLLYPSFRTWVLMSIPSSRTWLPPFFRMSEATRLTSGSAKITWSAVFICRVNLPMSLLWVLMLISFPSRKITTDSTISLLSRVLLMNDFPYTFTGLNSSLF